MPGNSGQDLDGDGFAALLEQSLNSSDTDPADRPLIDLAFESIDADSGPTSYLTLTFARDPLIESFLQVETSATLDAWLADAVLVSRQTQADGTELPKIPFPDTRIRSRAVHADSRYPLSICTNCPVIAQKRSSSNPDFP